MARSARSPARSIAVALGFGTCSSPLLNRIRIDFAGTPGSGSLRRYGAYATWLPDWFTQSLFSRYSWMAMAPATVLVTGGWSRSGMFSLNKGPEESATPPSVVTPGLLISEGVCDLSVVPRPDARVTGDSRLFSK